MADCVDRDVGLLLHGYEIGILTDEEKRQFEDHILKCEYCFDQLKKYDRETSILADSQEIREAVHNFVSDETKPDSPLKKLFNIFWPKAPLIFRPAFTYLLILLMVIPAYYGIRNLSDPGLRITGQKISFLDDRRNLGQSPVVDKSQTGSLSIVYGYENIAKNKGYRLEISYEDGSILDKKQVISGFNDYYMGEINIPLSKLKSGKYYLRIYDPEDKAEPLKKEYSFIVK